MSDTDSTQAAPLQSEQVLDSEAVDIPTLQGYLRLKERTGCQIEDIELFDPNGINVNVIDYLGVDLDTALALVPLEADEITSDAQLAQLLQTRTSVAYSVLKIGGQQTKVLLSRSVSSTATGTTTPPTTTTTSSSTTTPAAPQSPAAAAALKAQVDALPQVEFQQNGAQAPIRGKFAITSAQITALCTGSIASYSLYATAIAEDCATYGINPLFVLADFINQGVYAPYRNPWGISTDYYPYGPNGSQLGQPNGKVKNGPRKFGPDEWRTAFDRQFAVVATGNAYKNASTIAQWASIDAPPGASNDVNGTNAQEASDVGNLYNRLVTAFNQLPA